MPPVEPDEPGEPSVASPGPVAVAVPAAPPAPGAPPTLPLPPSPDHNPPAPPVGSASVPLAALPIRNCPDVVVMSPSATLPSGLLIQLSMPVCSEV